MGVLHARARFTSLVVAMAVAVITAIPSPAAAAGSVNVARDVAYTTVDGRPLHLDAYLPSRWETGRPAVVLVHAGAWDSGSRESLAHVADAFARHGWVAVTIEYRLASEAVSPAAAQDVQAAVRFVRERAHTVGVDPARIVLAGSSAGGNLAALAAMAGDGSHAAGSRVAAVVSWSGIYDMPGLVSQTATSPSLAWLGDAATRYVGCPATSLDPGCVGSWWIASPENHVDPSDPPVLLVHSEDEVTPFVQATAFESRLRDAGVEVDLLARAGSRHGDELIAPSWDATLHFIARTTGLVASSAS